MTSTSANTARTGRLMPSDARPLPFSVPYAELVQALSMAFVLVLLSSMVLCGIGLSKAFAGGGSDPGLRPDPRTMILPAASSSDPDSLESRGVQARAAREDASTSYAWGRGVWDSGSAGLALPTRFRAGEGATYTIPGLDQHLDNRLLVFNEHGERVFQQLGYQNGWDGTDREGRPLPPGRYFLMVELGGLGDDIQAYVQLTR